MLTSEQCEAVYHCGIGKILTAAYQRDFTMMEKGKCKTTYPTFKDWYVTLKQTNANVSIMCWLRSMAQMVMIQSS